ncbi:MAG: zinc-binding alcohol dehydrogenase family protein [SAR324 cluster bacterium]|nr:zinc-binding alcohol dehydrogenase family protein [SAR324 cluster bacterium]
MKAVGYKASMPIDEKGALEDITLPDPIPSNKDLLVSVRAVSVNPVDTKIRLRAAPEEGQYKVLGWDAAGVVEAIGPDVSMFKVGDEVWYSGAVDRPGTNSELHLVDERISAKKPEKLGFAEAAALPLTSVTAWELLFDRLQVDQDSKGTLLVIGAAGGVGSILIQLAKKLTGLTVIATASRAKSKEWVTSLGADYVINHNNSLVAQLKAIGFEQVPYIISLTHTDEYLKDIVEVIAPQGKFALIDDPPTLNAMPFKTKSVSIHWELMFTRSLFQTSDMIEQHRALQKLAEMVDAGEIKTTLGNNFGKITAVNLTKAHKVLEEGTAVGKIVLEGF